MAWKTICRFEPYFRLFSDDPNFDRFLLPEGPVKDQIVSLINRGELPRYRGPEMSHSYGPAEAVVNYTWNSLAVAEEYANWNLTFFDQNPIFLGVEIQEV